MNKFYNFINKANSEVAELYIEGEIVETDGIKEFLKEFWGEESTSSYGFAEELKKLNNKPLKIHCNSFGGSLFAGTAMYAALVNYKGAKTGYIGGVCASAATFPMLACDKTYMTSASAYCPHLPMTMAMGNRLDLQTAIDELTTVEEMMIDAYARKTNLKREKIRSILEADKFMNSGKAIELGFVDGLVEDEPKFDKAFIENIFSRNVAIYNSLYKNNNAICGETADDSPQDAFAEEVEEEQEPEKENMPSEAQIKAAQAEFDFLSLRYR